MSGIPTQPAGDLKTSCDDAPERELSDCELSQASGGVEDMPIDNIVLLKDAASAAIYG